VRMKNTFLKTWPLFFGVSMMMIGNGLQGTLLGVRASIEGFSVLTTGLIMSSYYFGFLMGSFQVPKFISKVGHIRVFAALASIASTAVLFHGVFVDPIMWFIVRAFTGFAYAGLYLVVESWLNDASTNKNRGTIMGAYMVVTFVGMAIGQGLLNIAEPDQIELFVITSVLVSLALVPIALSSRPAPDFSVNETISVYTIWKRSPLGIMGTLLSGLTSACIFSIAPLYALGIGLSNASLSGFMAAFMIGAMVLQMPIAWASDQIDRRKMIVALGGLSTITSFGFFIASPDNIFVLFAIMAILGGVSMPIYSQCLSHVNDHLNPRQFVASSGTLLLWNGLGAAMGPLLVTTIMQFFGPNGFAGLLVIGFATLCTFGIYRSFRTDSVPLEDQNDTIMMPARGSAMSIYSED
jgi:MFS family permease